VKPTLASLAKEGSVPIAEARAAKVIAIAIATRGTEPGMFNPFISI
jgi:hypothetical protein